MVSISLLLVLLAGLVGLHADADMPCSIYDVTTLRGSKLEVHSRTNAIGLKTNISDYPGFEGILGDSNLNCHFTGRETCSEWKLDGFEHMEQLEEDFIDYWTSITPNEITDHEVGVGGETFQQQRFYKYNVVDGYNYTIRFLPENYTSFFIIMDSIEGKNGLQFTVDLSNRSRVLYRRKDYRTNNYGGRYYEYPLDSDSTVELPKDDRVPTVFLRRHLGTWCLWMKNARHSEDCFLMEDSNNHWSRTFGSFSIVLNGLLTYKDFEVFIAREREELPMRLAGTIGSASVASLDVDSSRKLCISLRYFLRKGETANVQFIADDTSRKILHSATLQGRGKIVSRPFSMIIPEENKQGKIRITFGTESAKSFELRSSRKCSAKDLDVTIIGKVDVRHKMFEVARCAGWYVIVQTHSAIQSSQDIKYVIGHFRVKADKCPSVMLIYRNICYDSVSLTVGPNYKCYHGGLFIKGWCRCLPGFTGSACEKACPPGRFGADCLGACVDDPQCKGVLMAAPGQPMECARGFTGPTCEESCKPGFYGPNCRLECGQCLYGACNQFTGRCTGPCRQGYRNQTCHERLASVDRINISATTFDSSEVTVDVDLNEDEMKSYPFIKLLFKKEKASSSRWRSIILPLTSRTTKFTVDNLEYDKTYYLDAVLVHESGNFYQKSTWNVLEDLTNFSTQCIVGSFDKVDVIVEETKLNVSWEVKASEKYPCEISGFVLEVYLPEVDEPIRKVVVPQSRNEVVEAILLRYGSFRLGAIHRTKDTLYTYHEFSASRKTEISWKLELISKTARSIDFSWSSSDGLASDVVVCKAEPLLCMDRKLDDTKQKVRTGEFSLRGLFPFTRYICAMNVPQVEASTITQQDLPSASPKPHDDPIKVTNTTASIQWKDVDCLDINGVPKGFRVELWQGKTNEAITITSPSTLKTSYIDLIPETSYVVKIYVVNQLGWNLSQYLSISFRTKSTTPNAVTDLIVYKRTRNDLWLRWAPPENSSNDTVVVGYKITASAPGVKNQPSEIPPVQCSIWPGYFCHRLRSLIPDTEYTIEVQAKNDKIDSYGPSTATKAMTKEGVPDPPVNVRIQNRTANSVVLAWDVPLMLNSNPKIFAVTLEQTDENDSTEKPTDSLDKKINFEEKPTYEVKFEHLNPATTYVVTISAGLRGQRVIFSVNTPPKDPSIPPEPTVSDTSVPKLTVRGIQDMAAPLNLLLSGYLLLVSSNDSLNLNHGISDNDVAASIRSQFAESFLVAHEFSPNLSEEVFVFESEPPVLGNFSVIQNVRLENGQKYGFALAAVSTYCGAHAVSVSPVTSYFKAT